MDIEYQILRFDRKLCEWSDQATALVEELRVKWFMLDAQQKQIVLMVGMYAGFTILDIVKAKVAPGEVTK